jgi:tRNA (uracil-5-)-methyltransferase TRM9
MDFEKKFVLDVYSQISHHFNKTRYHSWPKIEDFINSFNKHSLVADVGCGNGRNCLVRKDVSFIGFEIVDEFITMCREKGIKTIKSDVLDIKTNSNLFDYTMCIAVIHHLSTEERRIDAIKELIRITKPGGKILIYVWAKEQDKFKNMDTKDLFVPWKMVKEGRTYERYYYVFELGELESLINKTGMNCSIIESGEQCCNYYTIIQKN